MEEGPEPHEGIERMVEHHHHEHEHKAEGKSRETLVSAVTAAVLAVCAALGSLLSGHAANEAILKQAKANDQWALYQAKSVKGHLYEADGELIKALGDLQKIPSADVAAKLSAFEAKVQKYEKEKEQLFEKAAELDAESKHEFTRHKSYSYGVAAFQVGIVLASISLLVRVRGLYLLLYVLSLVAGAVGVGFLVWGTLTPAEPPARPPQHEARLWLPPPDRPA
jgi:hypothetical protein